MNEDLDPTAPTDADAPEPRPQPDHGDEHGHGHGHDDEHGHDHVSGSAHDDPELARASPALRRRLGLAVALVLMVLLAGVVVLYPYGYTAPAPDTSLATIETFPATVTSVESTECGTSACLAIAVRVEDGPEAGRTVELPDMGGSSAVRPLGLGDEIVVSRVTILESGQTVYNFADRQRSTQLWILAIAFGVLVVAIARWRGAAALVGLGLTWIVVVGFLVPAILGGSNPVAVSLVAAGLVAIIVLYLAHGANARTTIALLGTLASLVLTGLLSVLFVHLTSLTGLASEEVGFIVAQGATVDARGLLLAGIIIGTLGVLTDITVTQVAVVWEVHAVDPSQPWRTLYAAGMRTGRDHIASTVDTLVLAYAGASIPLLVLFLIGNQSVGDVAAGELVAEEIVRTLLGSIGLVASVPFTTALAAVVVTRSTGWDRVDPGPAVPDLVPGDLAGDPPGGDPDGGAA